MLKGFFLFVFQIAFLQSIIAYFRTKFFKIILEFKERLVVLRKQLRNKIKEWLSIFQKVPTSLDLAAFLIKHIECT